VLKYALDGKGGATTEGGSRQGVQAWATRQPLVAIAWRRAEEDISKKQGFLNPFLNAPTGPFLIAATALLESQTKQITTKLAVCETPPPPRSLPRYATIEIPLLPLCLLKQRVDSGQTALLQLVPTKQMPRDADHPESSACPAPSTSLVEEVLLSRLSALLPTSTSTKMAVCSCAPRHVLQLR
jgi:hypothetical protein